jgi:RNA polymerase sigma factor (sigma-70 family)
MSPRLSDVLLRAQTDERLAALTCAGQEGAFVVLVQRYSRPLLHFARRLVGPDRAEDVVQQSLMRAWKALSSGTEVRHVRAWLHQIVRRSAYTELAKHPHEVSIEEHLTTIQAPELADHGLRLQAVMDELARLPDRQRAALVQTELEGRSRREVAADLGLSEGAVRQLVHRARVAMRLAVTSVTPFPLAAWAARGHLGGPASTRIAELADGAGLAGGTAGAGTVAAGSLGSAAKVGATLLAAGALGGGLALPGTPLHPGKHHRPPRAVDAAPSDVVPASMGGHTTSGRTGAGSHGDPAATNRRAPQAGLSPGSGSQRQHSSLDDRGETDRRELRDTRREDRQEASPSSPETEHPHESHHAESSGASHDAEHSTSGSGSGDSAQLPTPHESSDSRIGVGAGDAAAEAQHAEETAGRLTGSREPAPAPRTGPRD